MDPASLVIRIDLSPDVVFRIPYPAHTTANRATEHAETVCPFTDTASPCLQERPNVGVAGEPFVRAATSLGTLVQFHAGCAAGGFVGVRRAHSAADCRAVAVRARRIIDKLKEVALKPSSRSFTVSQVWSFHEWRRGDTVRFVLQQCLDDAILIPPGGLHVLAHAGGLRL